MLYFIILDKPIPAYERIWLVGDEFTLRTVGRYLSSEGSTANKGYAKGNYDVSDFCKSKFSSHNPSLIGRLIDCIADGIQKHVILPRIIVFILDDDLIKSLSYNKEGDSEFYGRMVEYLFRRVHREIADYKDKLPSKSKRGGLPHILWIEPPAHDAFPNNAKREKMITAMEKTADLYENMSSFYLKKVWNSEDSSLYHEDSRRYTARGEILYWDAVDSTVRYCDTLLKRGKLGKPVKQKHVDRFHWNNKQKMLPAPPPKWK